VIKRVDDEEEEEEEEEEEDEGEDEEGVAGVMGRGAVERGLAATSSSRDRQTSDRQPAQP
jgi:hypothetical protein